MTQEDKQLLLIDLCARLPYGVKAQIKATNCIDGINTLDLIDLNSFIKERPRDEDWYDVVTSIKPYLRPMSSMTEEEKVEYCDLQAMFLLSSQYPVTDGYALFDWLNAHHFDYRGLIPRGLAISTEEFNPYKD